MKKLLAGILFILSSTLLFGQATLDLDTIVQASGRRIYGKVTNVGAYDISYILPDKEDETYSIERKQIEKILFASGRRETFSKPIFEEIPDTGDWRSVIITRTKSDVEGLYFRGNIEAKAPPSTNKKRARDNAEIKIKKRAVGIKATYILAIGFSGESSDLFATCSND